MKKISIILLILCLCGCSTIKPSSTILIYPVDDEGIKKVEIEQTRLGKTEYKDKEISASYDSKGKSLLTGVTETATEIGKVIMLDNILD